MDKFKKKRRLALLSIVALFLMIVSISLVEETDRFEGLVKVDNASVESKLMGSVGDVFLDDNKVNDNSTIEYIVSFTLDKVQGVETRDVIVKGDLTAGEFKYARFQNIKGQNIDSTLTEDGKEIEVRVKNVKLGEEKIIKLELNIENAPSNTEIHPNIKVCESTSECIPVETRKIIIGKNN